MNDFFKKIEEIGCGVAKKNGFCQGFVARS